MIEMMTDRSIFRYRSADGKPHYRAQLIADTAAELAGVMEIGGVALDFGSVAHAVDDAQILRLDSSGDWIIQTGDDAGKTVDEVIAAASVQSSPKSAQGEQRKIDGIDLVDLEKALNEENEEEPTGDEKDEREPLSEIDEPIDEKDEKKEVIEPEPERKESGELKEVSADDKSE